MKPAVISTIITLIIGYAYIEYHYVVLHRLEEEGVIDSDRAKLLGDRLSDGYLMSMLLAVIVGIVTFIIVKIISAEKLKV